MSDAYSKPVMDFGDFIDAPPDYEEKLMVREYRHALAPKWLLVLDEIKRLQSQVRLLENRAEAAEALLNDDAPIAALGALRGERDQVDRQ